jgi:hypothetical protein
MFGVNIVNYNSEYTYKIQTTKGIAQTAQNPITGKLEISSMNTSFWIVDLGHGESADVTVMASRSGYLDGILKFTGTASLGVAYIPTLSNPTWNFSSDNYRTTFKVENMNPLYAFKASTTVGVVSLDAQGNALLTGLKCVDNGTVTVTSSRPGYAEGSANFGASLGCSTNK